MKRFPAIICSLLLVFVLFSCKNLTLTEKNRNTDSGKGTVFIRIPEVDATSRAAIVQAPGDVTKYSIRFYLVNKDEPVFSKDYTSAELNKGVTISLDPNDYKVRIDASDAKGLLFTGETASLVHVTLENTADNPAVASVFMKMVLACYDTGSEALVRYNGNTLLDDNVLPDVLVPVVQRLPEGNRTAANGYVITGWKDSNNGDQIYDAEEPIDLDGKKLPLRLTAVWGEPLEGYASSFADTKFYQISDVQWNSPLASGKALGVTVTGGQSIDYTCTGSEYLKLRNIQAGTPITADIYKYSDDNDTTGECIANYTIDAVTQYGIKTGTPFLFTGEGLNHYNSIPEGTNENSDGYRMSSAMIINAPATESAINDALSGLVRLRTADDVLAVMNNSSDDKYTKRYLVENDITVTVLPKSLFEKKFNGYFNGQGHTITVTTGNAPLFKDIGASGEVSGLNLTGDFSSYTEPYRDFGVLCSNNYGKLHDCSFTGTAPSSTSIGTVSVFGYQAPGSTYSNNANSSSAADTSDMYQITMIPITGATVSTSVGAGAFASAGTTPVTVGNFLIAEAEVTYKQWREVYEWATSDERGSKKYTFSSSGTGYGGTAGAEPTEETATKPVTEIYYRDMIVWCNAASEKQGLDPVYYAEGTTGNGFLDDTKVVRVVNANLRNAEKAVPNPAANGYRLPEAKEWEYAARGGDLTDTTAWKYTYAGSNSLQGIAVHYSCYINGVSGSKYSHVVNVKTLKPNTAGLYDMSGNAGEYLFLLDSVNGNRNKSGGEGGIATLNTVDPHTSVATASTSDASSGFRVVRSIVN